MSYWCYTNKLTLPLFFFFFFWFAVFKTFLGLWTLCMCSPQPISPSKLLRWALDSIKMYQPGDRLYARIQKEPLNLRRGANFECCVYNLQHKSHWFSQKHPNHTVGAGMHVLGWVDNLTWSLCWSKVCKLTDKSRGENKSIQSVKVSLSCLGISSNDDDCAGGEVGRPSNH